MPTRVIALLLLLLAGVGLIGCGEDGGQEPLPPLPAATDLTAHLVTDNLNAPVFMAVAPGDNSRLFIVEQRGAIRIFTGSALLPTSFLNITGLVRTAGGEEGLLSMAFDPSYGANGRV